MPGWTAERVLAAAPDRASAGAARRLARSSTWSELGTAGTLVFGRCQGSGAQPYQVTVELSEPAFACSCPSRKQPCKHGLALLLLWVEHGDLVGEVAPAAEFAREWDARRREQAARRAARAAAGSRAAGAEAQQHRRAEREATMTAGLDDFEQWLHDLLRRGLAGARGRPYAFWDGAAARLVDAQVPSLADRVRRVGGSLAGRVDWADVLLAECGNWQLAIHAWRRRETLTPALRADLRTFLGWPRRADEVAGFERVRDRWVVAGVRQGDDGRIASQRTWMWGQETGRWVVMLDFAASGAALRVAQVVGGVVDDEVVVYPGSDPARAAWSGEERVVGMAALPAAQTVAEAVDALASWLGANPWRDRLPVVLQAVVPVAGPQGDWWLRDERGDRLPLARSLQPWSLLALSGGLPVTVAAEWDGGVVYPMAVAFAGEPVPL